MTHNQHRQTRTHRQRRASGTAVPLVNEMEKMTYITARQRDKHTHTHTSENW